MRLTVDEIKEKARKVLVEEQVIRSSLFGSYARGEEREESDVDVLVELPKGRSLVDLSRLERRLGEALGKDVDVVTFNSIDPSVKDAVERSQLPLL